MLGDVADLYEQPGLGYIRRDEGFRTVRVYASIDEAVITPNEAVEEVKNNIMRYTPVLSRNWVVRFRSSRSSNWR